MSKKTSTIPTWAGIIVPIAVAFIGVIGTVTPVLVATLSTPSPNDPKVEIWIGPAYNSSSLDEFQGTGVTLTNLGFAAATNVTLLVDASAKIANTSDYTLNTTEVYPVEIEDRRLVAYIPKLVHGSGSIVKLNISFSDPLAEGRISTYVTYDQGSGFAAVTYFQGSEILDAPIQILEPDLLAYYFIFYTVFIPLLMIYLILRLRRIWRRKPVLKIIENITGIRRALKDNNKSTNVFVNVWKWDATEKKKDVQGYIKKRMYKTMSSLTIFMQN